MWHISRRKAEPNRRQRADRSAGRSSTAHRTFWRRLDFEWLETRQMLSAASGPEVRVNSYTNGAQEAPKVASDAAGDYVVVWEDFTQKPGIEIYAQRYNAAGAAQGTEFQVSSATDSFETNPSVAMDANGDFVIAWQGYKYSSNDGYGDITDLYNVYAQRYDAAGRALGSNFEVNTNQLEQQFEPSVAMDSAGDFVIVWSGYGDHSGYGIFAQRYNASGATVGVSNFQINTYTNAGQYNPSAAMDAEGDFVIAWSSVNEDGSDEGIYAQRYNSGGLRQGLQFQVSTFTPGIQQSPSAAMDSQGDFVIAWESGSYDGSVAQDGSGFGIYAQRYNAAGMRLGSEFRVNTFTPNNQLSPAVSMDSAGDFNIAWVSGTFNGSGSATEDGSGYGIYAQQYNASGVTQGSEFRVNTYTTSNQGSLTDGPGIAEDAAGDFIVAWASNGQDGSGYGIYAQQYSSGSTAAALSDPGFELPALGSGPSAYQYNPPGSPWTFNGYAGVAGNASGFTASNPNAPQGSQVAFIQMTGSVSQSFNLCAGHLRCKPARSPARHRLIATDDSSARRWPTRQQHHARWRELCFVHQRQLCHRRRR